MWIFDTVNFSNSDLWISEDALLNPSDPSIHAKASEVLAESILNSA